ncbi:MAG: type II toxin-antitoxin system VapC family toxin [Alphaproteobacteria bacterium]|nr:type II toxin-antitoxin system VapC family toxin [Alphaproteobacteria bacterium]
MIVLDTNVVSALMRSSLDPAAAPWLDRQPSRSVWTTAITIYELRYGLALLPAGRRRTTLGDALEQVLNADLDRRILPFDSVAADAAANIAAHRRQKGKSLDVKDIQIAGIVAARRATLATRNVRHFTDFGIRLVNPWDER